MRTLVPLIISFFALIIVVGVYGFMYTQVADGVERTGAALAKTESLSSRDALIRSQQIFLEDSLEERTNLQKFVADNSQIIEIIEIIENTASSNRVDLAISNISTVSRNGWQLHEGIVVDFSASGSFSRMMDLIASLEALPMASVLQNASLEVSGKGEWFGTFSVMFVKVK